MSPVPCMLSSVMLCLLNLIYHPVICSLLLYRSHVMRLGQLHFQHFSAHLLKIIT